MEDQQNTKIEGAPDQHDSDTTQNEEAHTDESVSKAVLGQRIVFYIGSSILILLAVRFLLLLLGASRNSSFVDFVYNLSSVFVAPFNGIFEEPTYGSSVFDTATLVAMLIYAILMVGIAKLLTLNRTDSAVN